MVHRGTNLLQEKNVGAAVMLFKSAANGGNPHGMTKLGCIALREKNKLEARVWLELALISDLEIVCGGCFKRACFMLAMLGERPDRKLLELAAARNHALALFELSRIYAASGDVERAQKLKESAIANGLVVDDSWCCVQ
jgi:TPR repeat protein